MFNKSIKAGFEQNSKKKWKINLTRNALVESRTQDLPLTKRVL